MNAAVNPSSAPAAPRWPRVMREQFRTTGLAVRGEVLLVSTLLAVVTLLTLSYHARGEASGNFKLTDTGILAVVLGLFAPMAVWKGEAPARRSYLWAMPLDRSRHTLVKVFSGWAWLMALVAMLLLWELATPLLTGGGVGSGVGAPHGFDLTLGGQPWMWLVPFTGATVASLAGSVVVISSDHPWRWFAGATLGVLLASLANVVAVPRILFLTLFGRYGLQALLTGTADRVTAAGAELVPDPRGWAVATLIWTGLALGGVLVAAHRYQER
jgi:hypothetical protein